MPYNTESVLIKLVSKSTQAIETIIGTPGVGKRLAIDYVFLNASGGANVVTLTGNVAVPVSLANLDNLQLDNAIHNRLGIFPCNEDQALKLTLGSATTVGGFILYRIING